MLTITSPLIVKHGKQPKSLIRGAELNKLRHICSIDYPAAIQMMLTKNFQQYRIQLEWPQHSRKLCYPTGPEAGSHRPPFPAALHSDVPCRPLMRLVSGRWVQQLFQDSPLDTSWLRGKMGSFSLKSKEAQEAPHQTPPCCRSLLADASPCPLKTGRWQGSGVYHDRLVVGTASHPTWEIVLQCEAEKAI